MDRNDLQVDRRTLLRAASFLSVIPADVGDAWATEPGGDASGAPGAEAGPVPSPTRRLAGYAYGGTPLVAGPVTAGESAPAARPDGTARDDPQGYGENGYGGHVP
jgi:hypothetical protein